MIGSKLGHYEILELMGGLYCCDGSS
jgi:hypothetical protein